MKIHQLFFLILLLTGRICYSQVTINNIQTASTIVYVDASTPNNPNSYTWSEISNTKQGVHISVIPPERGEIYLQQNNSWINFNSWNYGFMTSLDIKYDNGNWQNIFSTTKDATGWQTSPFLTLGQHSIAVRWRDLAGYTHLRDYDVFAVPQSQKFFKDNYGNTLTLWDGGNANKVILISEGFDPYNTTYSEYLRHKGKDLFEPLIQAGYNVYFLNYVYNSQSMRNSAAIYNSAARYISSLNFNTSMTAAGVSMGGVIVRYALTKAENDGNPLPFNKFASIDAPQQGAIFAKDLQDFMKDEAENFQKHGLNNDAAKELLVENSFGNLYTDFYNELKGLNEGRGYPSLTKNIGVSFSNGSPNPGNGRWVAVTFELQLLPGTYIYKTSWLNETLKQPGSYLPKSTVASNPSPFNYGWFIAGMTQTERDPNNHPTFIPYNSSLDIVNGNSKSDVTIQANANYFHDEFPPEIIDPLIKAVMDPYLITIKKEFEFDGTENSVEDAYQGFPFTFSVQSTVLKNGKTYNFAGWTDGNTTNPRTITPQGNETYTALYKTLHKSNQTNAYSNPSQRRFIQTPDGVKHICYESMNRVWIEHSTDNGTTWYLGNGGKPLSSADSKNPSMSFYGNQIGIVWQEKSGSSFKIKMALFWMSDYSSSLFETIAEDANDYSHNANPVVEWGYNGKVVVVYSGFDLCINPFGGTALKYWYGDATSNGISQLSQCSIAGTDVNSINPTITANYSLYTNPFYFHFAWQQVINSNTSKILYCAFYSDQNNSLLGTGITEVSYNSGYSKNYHPRILLRKVNTEYLPFITWLGYRNTPSVATNVITRYKQYGSWSPFSVYGNSSVQSFSINNAGYQYYQDILGLGWSEPVSPGVPVYVNKAVKIGLSSTISTLSTSGKDLQINNSNGLSSMFVNSYKSNALPYNFTLSQPFSSLNKENSMAIFNGREGIVGKNGAQFFFALGDISVDGQTVEFIQIPDSLETNNLATVNNYFESEPFLVNSNSNLTYGVEYGMVDSVLCSSVLKNNGKITFKVELIDDKTNEVLDVFDEVTYSEKDVFQYDNIGYKVNLDGIGEKTIRLRLSTNTNLSFDNSLSNRISDQNMLAKTGYRNINYQGKSVVTEYALEQNYPNPFNPNTTIKYQIPASLNPSKGGTLVTLKVYDILGNEVATLINEEKPAGRYEINFNASSLASGVYIYKIQAGSFISSKKMLLLK